MQNFSRVALLPAKGMGDALVIMIAAYNLRQNGCEVTFFSDYVYQLRDWFPLVKVKPFPQPEKLEPALANFDKVFMDVGKIAHSKNVKPYLTSKYFLFSTAEQLEEFPNDDVLAKRTVLIGNLVEGDPLVDKMVVFCRDILELKQAVKENGITPLKGLQYRKYNKRIMIHPTCTNVSRRWPPEKFIKLARILKHQGWEPAFSLSPAELPEWKTIVNNEFLLPEFPGISDLASFLYESGYFIGNDSGPGHLASCLMIPTLSIWKKVKKRRWQPGWAISELALPLKIPFFIKSRRHWHRLLSVKRVLKAFKRLSKQKI